MSNIENQIVSMQFDNKQFESGVSTSLGTIDKLKSSLAFPDAGKGLTEVTAAAGKFDMTPMSNEIEKVSRLWLGMATIAITTISNITNKVVDSGIELAKSFTIDPITQGFQEYEKDLNSIQTIMANTGAKVEVVNGYLEDLNHYSDQTIYSFGTMADSIGKFTAAGVKLPDATDAIKGMANSAALGGSSVDQLNTAMYQVSQALATGTIRLMDWNSVSTAGMGGTNMQKAFEATARTAADGGAAMDAAVKSAGSFRESLQAGWFSADIFNKTMKVFAGKTLPKSGKTIAYTVKQLQGMGYSLKAAKDLNKLSAAAIDSATKVKTFSQLIDVVKESIGSGWAKVFEDVFGNFEQASKLWTGVSETITGAVGKVFEAVDKMLTGWRDLGGFEELWGAVGNVFKILGNLIHPVIVLFQALLPSTGKAGSGLEKVTSFLEKFTGFLVKLTDPLGKFELHFSFMGKLFKIVGGTVSAFISALKPLVPILEKIGGYVGDLFNQGMQIAGSLIEGWTAGLDPQALKDGAVKLANSWVTWIKDALGIHSPASTMVPIGLSVMQGIVEGLQKGATLVIHGLQKLFAGIGNVLKYMAANISWGDILSTINTGLFLGLVLTFRQFLKVFKGTVASFKEVTEKAGGVLDQVTSNLKTMQSKVKSEIIRNIAISVLLLAGAALLLSTIDGKKLAYALGAIGGLMAGLVTAMLAVTSGGGGKHNAATSPKAIAQKTAQLFALSTALIAFSSAILILSGAVAILGALDPKALQRGLEAVGALVAGITAATAILSKTGGGATIFATASALAVLAPALLAFVVVMKVYEKLDWKTLVRGGGSAAAVILALGLAMRGFGKNAITGSVGLVIASAALLIIAKAMQKFASIGVADMIKSVIALEFIVEALAFAAKEMSASEGGAAAMLVMAAAIIVLAYGLKIISKIPLLDLAKAIGAITIAILIIAGTSAALSELAPLIAALGTALLFVGGALFLAGAGVFLFASGMALLAVVGPASFQALADGIDILVKKLPEIGLAIGGFLVSILTGVAQAAGPLAHALGKLIGILLDEIAKLIPKAAHLIIVLIRALIRIVFANAKNFYKAGIKFVLGFLDALTEAVPKFIRKGTALIIAIIQGLGKAAVKIANATGKTILQFLDGLDAAIVKYEPQILQKGAKIAVDLIDGLTGGLLTTGLQKVKDAAQKLADALPGWMRKILGIGSPSTVMRDQVGKWAALGVSQGLDHNATHVKRSAEDLADNAVKSMHAAFKSSIEKANGLKDIQPKITPVLDLTQLEKDARGIGSHLGKHTISANFSRRSARGIASDAAARHHTQDDGQSDNYAFVQNNYSPKPINHIQAYRGTKSQIALFKEVTGK